MVSRQPRIAFLSPRDKTLTTHLI